MAIVGHGTEWLVTGQRSIGPYLCVEDAKAALLVLRKFDGGRASAQ